MQFTSSTAFNVNSAALGGLIGTGTITTDCSPANPAFARPYWIVLASGWAGTWAIGDTLSFKVHNGHGVWLKRIIPASCAALASNNTAISILGDSP